MLQQNRMKQDLLVMIQNSETVSDVVAIYAEKYQPHFTLRSNAYAFSSLVCILLLTKNSKD